MSNSMTLKPLHDRIMIKRIDRGEETTEGGLFIPDSAKEPPQEGMVMDAGSGRRLDNGQLISPSVKRGDHVLFGKYSGQEIEISGHTLVFIKDEDILAVIVEDEPTND